MKGEDKGEGKDRIKIKFLHIDEVTKFQIFMTKL